ncbi:MAG: hypothetical protein H6673_07970 [Anaerolineales bacterium]|nr:hypothetical protein [Anaerolineales bacterium]
MSHLQTIVFGQGLTAKMCVVDQQVQPDLALTMLQVPYCRATIIIHSGAGQMEDIYTHQLMDLFTEGLARFAQHHQVMIADGGTHAGGVKIIGQARHTLKATFPLVGVAVTQTVTFPGGPLKTPNRWPLNAYHSHFLLVKADVFSAESPLLMGLATARPVPALAIIVNGGDIVREESLVHAKHQIPLVVLKGSGRFADELADSAPDSELRAKYPADKLYIFDTNTQTPQEFYNLLHQILFGD